MVESGKADVSRRQKSFLHEFGLEFRAVASCYLLLLAFLAGFMFGGRIAANRERGRQSRIVLADLDLVRRLEDSDLFSASTAGRSQVLKEFRNAYLRECRPVEEPER